MIPTNPQSCARALAQLVALLLCLVMGGALTRVRIDTVAGSMPDQLAARGFVDGDGSNARFSGPADVVVDPQTSTLYVTDYSSCAIRALNTSTFRVSTVAGCTPATGVLCGHVDHAIGTLARFWNPTGLAIHDGVLYISENGNHDIRTLQLGRTNTVGTLAGQTTSGYVDGNGTNAKFSGPAGLAFHAPSNSLLVADTYNHVIRKINIETKQVNTVAGYNTNPPSTTLYGFSDGVGTDARLYYPYGIAASSNDNLAFVADQFNQAVRAIDLDFTVVLTVAGRTPPSTPVVGYANGPPTTARFHNPRGIAYDLHHQDAWVVVDYSNGVVRLLSVGANSVSTLLGTAPPSTALGYVDGNGTNARMSNPTGIVPFRTKDQRGYWLADSANFAIRRILLPPVTLSQSATHSAVHPTATNGTASASHDASCERSLTRSNSVDVSASGAASTSHSAYTTTASKSISYTATHTTAYSGESTSTQQRYETRLTASLTKSESWSANATASPSQSCEPPLVEWHRFRYDAINLSTDYLTVALQPSASPFLAVGVSAGAVWTSLALPLATLQRGSPFVLNLSSSAAGVSLRSASVVHSSGGDTAPLVEAELVQQSSDTTPPRFRLLKLSLPPNTNWIQPRAAAVTMSLVFSGCDNRTATTATILVDLLPAPLAEQIPIVSSVVGSTTAVVGVTTATTAARVGAVRTLLLCTTTGASTGGLLGLSIARPEVDGDDVEVLPSARGAVVGNVVAVCVVGAVLCVVCCVYSVRCGVSLRASALRLALPSSLLPVLVAVLPSTMGAVVYLSHSGSVSQGGGGVVAALVVVGALLCAVPLGLLAWIAFVLPSRLGLVVKPEKREIERSSASNALVSTLRWLHRSLSAEHWVWEAKERPATTDKVTPLLVAPERAGRIVLLEHRLLWFSVLDVTLVAFIAGLGVGSAFGGPSTCRASLIAVVVLLALETVLCTALRPFTTLRSQVTVVLTLGCTTLSAALQLVAATMNNEDTLLASAAVDLAVLGMTTARLLLFDAPEMLRAAREVVREIAAGSCDGGEFNVNTVTQRSDLISPSDPQFNVLSQPALNMNDDDFGRTKRSPDLVAKSETDDLLGPDEELQSRFWESDGRAKAARHAGMDDDVPHNDLLGFYGVVMASKEDEL